MFQYSIINRTLLLAIVIINTAVALLAQEPTSKQPFEKFGIAGGLSYNLHTANFTKLPGIPSCCPRFETGTGIGFYGSALYERSIGEPLWLSVRLGVQSFDALLSKIEPTTIMGDNGIVAGQFEHTLQSNFMNLGIEPGVMYELIPNLYVNAGARIGLNMTSTYDQKETIVQPAGKGTFIDPNTGASTNKRTRNESNGDIPDATALQLGVLAGISYELPLNKDKSFRLAPEVSFYYGLTNLANEIEWSANAVRGGVAIKYVPTEAPIKQKLEERKSQIDTIKILSDATKENKYIRGEEKTSSSVEETNSTIITTFLTNRTDTLIVPKLYLLDGSIVAVGLDENGNEMPNPQFKVEEFVSNRLDPLLNYVFFDENSAELVKKYSQLNSVGKQNFSTDSLYYESTLGIYYNILNIVGERLNKFPNSKIRLVGCNADYGQEQGNTALSLSRAESIKKYLTTTWGVAPERITTESRNLPEKASTPKTENYKSSENRRVEIYSDDDAILEPVFLSRIVRTSNPPKVRFKAIANAEAGLKAWTIEAYQASSPNDRYIDKAESPQVAPKDWVLVDLQKVIPKIPEPITYNLLLEDTKGNQKLITNQSLPVDVLTIQKKRKELQGDYEIEKFSLILFEFSSASIGSKNKKIVDFIKKRIKPGSEIEIIGFTDQTGSEDFNQTLSTNRAKETLKQIESKTAKFKGVGSDNLLYDNTIPEGRFYCRTVEITVKTLVKE